MGEVQAPAVKVFCGYDPREASGFHVFTQSLIENATVPVSIIPLSGEQRDGSNTFIYARFFVPYLCGFQGWAIFVDGSDMLMRADIADLIGLCDLRSAVQVVKHDYKTRHPRKYLGTPLETNNADYPRKNWSSVILWNCGHFKNRILTPEYVDKHDGSHLHRFRWLPDEDIGTLPSAWNALVGEQGVDGAKIAHFTLGHPGMKAYRHMPYADEWLECYARANRHAGEAVHAHKRAA